MDKVTFVLALNEKSSEVLNQDNYVDAADGSNKEVTEVLAPLTLEVRITS